VEIDTLTGQVGVLATFEMRLTRIVVSCDPDYYEEDQWSMEKCGVLHVDGVQRLPCRPILEFAELLINDVTTAYTNNTVLICVSIYFRSIFRRLIHTLRWNYCAFIITQHQFILHYS